MKRWGLVLAAAMLAGLPVAAKADDDHNFGDARRRLANHQNEEYRRLLGHQRSERDACRYDRYNARCRNLKQHQKRERDRLKAHHKRERNRYDARRDGRGRDGRYGFDDRSGRDSRQGRGLGRY